MGKDLIGYWYPYAYLPGNWPAGDVGQWVNLASLRDGEQVLHFFNDIKYTTVSAAMPVGSFAYYTFDGVDSYMDTSAAYGGDVLSIDLQKQYTIEMWVKLRRDGAQVTFSENPVFSLGNKTLSGLVVTYKRREGIDAENRDTEYYYSIYINNRNYIVPIFIWNIGLDNLYYNNPLGALGGMPSHCTTIPVSCTGPWFWHFLSVSNTTTGVNVFINGKQAGSLDSYLEVTTNNPPIVAPLTIGRAASGNGYMYSPIMDIGHIIVYDRALTEKESRVNYTTTHDIAGSRLYGNIFDMK